MVKINLLPIREILRKRELKQFALFAGAAVASVIALTIVAYLYLSWTISGYQKRQANLQKELNQLSICSFNRPLAITRVADNWPR